MVVELRQLLKLVGPLDDSDDADSSSARLRDYLKHSVTQVADLRSYVDTCLKQKGSQYDYALQDVINHIGRLLQFEVEFGRYRGVRGEIGFDGLWISPSGWHLVAEARTTDVFAKTATVLGYVNDLVSEGRIKDPSSALGLYVFGQLSAEENQLEKAILSEGRTDKLRVISVGSLLNLLELAEEYRLSHDTILSLLLPSGVRVDSVVDLIFNLLSPAPAVAAGEEIPLETEQVPEEGIGCYMLPAADSEDGTPVLQNLHRWLDKGLWGLGERTAHRASIAAGDRLCFYASGVGIVVEATAGSAAFELDPKDSPSPVEVPYGLKLRDVRWFEDAPVQITAGLRARLDYFKGRDLSRGWGWFVQSTKPVSSNDFRLLTGRD